MKKIKEKFFGYVVGASIGETYISKKVEELSVDEIEEILKEGGEALLKDKGEEMWEEVLDTEEVLDGVTVPITEGVKDVTDIIKTIKNNVKNEKKA